MKNISEQKVSRLEKEGTAHATVTLKNFFGVRPIHWHNFYELELILEGVGSHILNGEEYPIKRGSAHLLTPTDFHTLKATEPMKLWHVSFDEQMLTERRMYELSSDGVQKSFELGEKTMTHLSNLLELLRDESNIEYGCSKELCESILCILLRSSPDKRKIKRTQVSGIRRAMLYINMHFRENPSLTDVAKQAGFHPNYFSELFKEVTGENYTAHLTTLKLGYAKSLLSAGVSVSDACYNSGFGSLSGFLTAFKKGVGMTPYEYKKSTSV
ncbi:MAG: helix-turn-helix domain-containing protein [Ruminococcaceae bacterium]|nr:helix-turn-helix domain-containing protein [Oscillospiraceae bacterium]